jgi:putative transposase
LDSKQCLLINRVASEREAIRDGIGKSKRTAEAVSQRQRSRELYRARLNSWSYYEIQRQIEYKAKWEGIPVVYVAARGTSVNCSTCGARTYPNERRGLYCARCRTTVDRDVSAAGNILAKGALRFGANGPPGEAMVAEREQSEATLIRTVDGGKSVHAQ